MQPDCRDTVKQICFDIFEQLAFMFGDELPKDEAQSDDEDFIQVVMTFTGHRRGEVSITVPRPVAPMLAHNILGIDEGEHLEAGMADDAIKELLNTICGRILPALFSDTATFDLHPPRLEIISRAQWLEKLEREDPVVFSIEENPILMDILLTD